MVRFRYDTQVESGAAKLRMSDVRRISGNRDEFVRQAVTEKLAREANPEWRPKTASGRKLLKLRNQFLAVGGELLDADGIAEELRQRREGSYTKATSVATGSLPTPIADNQGCVATATCNQLGRARHRRHHCM